MGILSCFHRKNKSAYLDEKGNIQFDKLKRDAVNSLINITPMIFSHNVVDAKGSRLPHCCANPIFRAGGFTTDAQISDIVNYFSKIPDFREAYEIRPVVDNLINSSGLKRVNRGVEIIIKDIDKAYEYYRHFH